MEGLIGLLFGLVIGAIGMYLICKNNISKIGNEKEYFKRKFEKLQKRLRDGK